MKKQTLTIPGIMVLLMFAAQCIAVTVAAAQVSRLSASAPVAPQTQRTMADYASVLERGLFGDGAPSEPGAASSSIYRLIGTVQSERFAGAVLDDGAGMQGFYLLNQKLPDASQIVNVRRDRVSLKGPDGIVRELQVVDDSRIVDTGKPAAQGSPPLRLAEPPRPAIQPVTQGVPQEQSGVKPQPYSEQVTAATGDAPGIDPVVQEAPPAASPPGGVSRRQRSRHSSSDED